MNIAIYRKVFLKSISAVLNAVNIKDIHADPYRPLFTLLSSSTKRGLA